MLQRANATFLRLAAMTPDAVADMVQDAVRARADASLLNLAAKAHGNPFLVSELVGGLGEEGRLDVSGGRAVATGDDLAATAERSMQQRLDLLSDSAIGGGAGGRGAAGPVLGRLLAAMLDRQPASLLSALEEAVRADLLVEDGEQLRFRHDLLREATRQSLPQSLRRAMERQSASVMLGMGAAPAEVATQLARSAEPGDQEAIDALRQAAQSVGRGDAERGRGLEQARVGAVARRRRRTRVTGRRNGGVAQPGQPLRRGRRIGRRGALGGGSPEDEAEIRLRLRTPITDTTTRARSRRTAARCS